LILSSRPDPRRRLALGLMASAVLHCLLFGVPLGLPVWRAQPRPADEGKAFKLRLIPPKPASAAVSAPVSVFPSASRAASASARRTMRPPAPAPAPDPVAGAPVIGGAPPLDTAASAPIEGGGTQAGVAGIMEAARREAASIARGMNRAPGADADFRSRVQQDLDRHFDAAHAAAGSWTRAAGITDITRASDGATRIYRIVTPLGTFCMTYTGGSGRPGYSTCPR